MNPLLTIVAYNPRWPTLFELERLCVQRALGDKLLAIEHIGSTAVPGLAAKPIVDLMVAVRDITVACASLDPLRAIGYDERTSQGDHPEWFYCLGKPLERDTHCHLHLVKTHSDFWMRHLRFRNALRADPGLARRYESLKRELATQYADDREGYTNAKSAFIESVIERVTTDCG